MKKILWLVNLLSAEYMIFWSVSPLVYHSDVCSLIMFIAIVAWFISAVLISPKLMLTKPQWTIILNYILLAYIVVVSYINNGQAEISRQTALVIFLTLLLVGQFYHFSNNTVAIKWVVLSSVLFVAVFAWITFFAHLSFPIISRAMTGNGNLDRVAYHRKGVGAAGIVYISAMAGPILLHFLLRGQSSADPYHILSVKNPKTQKIIDNVFLGLIILAMIGMFSLVIIAKFTFGLATMVFASILILFWNKKKWLLFAFLGVIVFLVIFAVLIYNNIIVVPEAFSSYINKLNDVMLSIISGKAQGALALRFMFYGESLKMITRYPLFGCTFIPTEIGGGHSFILDVVANFGVIVGSLIVFITFYLPLTLLKQKNKKASSLVIPILGSMLIALLFNSLLHGMGVPLYIWLVYMAGLYQEKA